jgi:hypothetical protein
VYRPVLIEGLIDGWPARSKWEKSEFLRRYGDVELAVASVPSVAKMI